MAEEFVSDVEVQNVGEAPSGSSRELIKHALYGSKRAIAHTIYSLYLKGYAEPGDWSRPQPTQQAGEFISILVRYLMIQDG
jgi:hypothetical protein